MNGILTWDDLNKFEVEDLDRVNGINNSYANLRYHGLYQDLQLQIFLNHPMSKSHSLFELKL